MDRSALPNRRTFTVAATLVPLTSQDAECTILPTVITAATGYSDRTVRMALAELCDLGALTSRSHGSAPGRRYTRHAHPVWDAVELLAVAS